MSNRTALRMRVLPRYPARISGANGLTIEQSSPDLVVKPDFGSLIAVPSVSNHAATYFWAWDSTIDSYSRITFDNLVSNIQDVIIGENLAGLAAVTSAADKVPYFIDGDGNASTYTVSSYVRSVSGAADEAAYLSAIGAATEAQGGLADTSVQPARTISAGTGLMGGGDLSANRSLALNPASIASLALADTAVQPAAVPALVASADSLANVAIAGRDFSLPADFGTGTAAAINAMILAMGSRHGGEIVLPATSALILDAPIDNYVSSVLVRGPNGIKPAIHGVSGTDYGLTIVPSYAGIVLRHRTRYASETGQPAGPRNTGGGFANMRVIGNGLATRLLDVDSVSDGVYDLYLQDAVGTEAALFHCGATGTDLAEACDIQRARIRLIVRQLNAGAAQSANCVVFSGSSTANTSLNKEVFLDLQHYNGHGLVHANSDNNTVWMRSFVASGGTGRCYVNKGGATAAVTGRANFWSFLSANTQGYTEGTGDAVVASLGNRILISDADNGTPAPLLGTGAGCVEEGVVRAYTPTITANSGTLTTVTVDSHRYTVSGRMVTVRGQITIVAKGTGATLLKVSLPTALPMRAGVADGTLAGTCKTTGTSIHGNVTVANGAVIRFYNAADTCVDGNVYNYIFMYEAY